MSFQAVSHFAQTWGLVLLVVLFAAVLAYALWPGNRKRFERAARAPLEDDKEGDDGRQE
jgi:cytochrome c oxidase cbb3-type subunit 4